VTFTVTAEIADTHTDLAALRRATNPAFRGVVVIDGKVEQTAVALPDDEQQTALGI